MPILQNQRHEAFARARASGARLDDAYEDAGFVPGNGHASRLALRPEVSERIVELRAANTALDEANPQAMIAALLGLAKAGGALADGAGIREARLAILDACRLRDAVGLERDDERRRAEELYDYVDILSRYERAERRRARQSPPITADGSPPPRLLDAAAAPPARP